MAESINKDVMEINKKYLITLLANGHFSASALILDIIISEINKGNYKEYLDMIKEAILEGRVNRFMEDKTTSTISVISGSQTQSAIDADNEARLMVYVAQSIYTQLELDNLFLNRTQEEIDEINLDLDAFVSKVIGDWFYKDDLDWREKNVETVK